jgi:hypothetical protein
LRFVVSLFPLLHVQVVQDHSLVLSVQIFQLFSQLEFVCLIELIIFARNEMLYVLQLWAGQRARLSVLGLEESRAVSGGLGRFHKVF